MPATHRPPHCPLPAWPPVAPACPALRLRAKTPRTGCVAAMRTVTVTLLLLPLDRFPSPVMAGTADVPGVNATSHTNCSSEAPAWFPATAPDLCSRFLACEIRAKPLRAAAKRHRRDRARAKRAKQGLPRGVLSRLRGSILPPRGELDP